MAGFNINDLLNAKSKGAAVQTEGPAEQETGPSPLKPELADVN